MDIVFSGDDSLILTYCRKISVYSEVQYLVLHAAQIV